MLAHRGCRIGASGIASMDNSAVIVWHLIRLFCYGDLLWLDSLSRRMLKRCFLSEHVTSLVLFDLRCNYSVIVGHCRDSTAVLRSILEL